MRKHSPFCSIVLFFCLHYTITGAAQLQKIYLNPKSAISAKQSQFIDSIQIIPLQLQDGAQVGYQNLNITDQYFLITDQSVGAILVYGRDGRFIKRIVYKNLGEDFSAVYHASTNQIVFFGKNKNYALTPKDQVKIGLGWDDPRNKKYFKRYVVDLNDSLFILKKSTPTQHDISGSNPFYDNHYWQGRITTSPVYKDSFDYEIKIYKDHQVVKSLFPYNRINEPRFLFTQESAMYSKAGQPYSGFILRPYCDTIYKMVNDSLFPAYQLITPLENSLPLSFFTKPFKNKTERENFSRNNGWMLHQVYSFYDTKNVIFLLVSYLTNLEMYIYQKQTNTTYKVKNIKPDSSHYNMPLLTDYYYQRRGDWFYKTQKAGELLAYLKQHKDVPVTKELENFIKTNPPATAPVIVAFKFKN